MNIDESTDRNLTKVTKKTQMLRVIPCKTRNILKLFLTRGSNWN